MVADPVHTHRRASLDRAVLGKGHTAVALLEVKCTSERSGSLDDDELIKRYSPQIQWYLGITGLPVAHLAVLIGTSELRTFTILFDQPYYGTLCEQVDRWWHDHMVLDEPPLMGWRDNQTAQRLPADPDTTLLADEKAAETVRTLRELKAMHKDTAAAIDTLEAELKGYLDAATDLVDATGNTCATWRPVTSRRFDSALLKKEDPDVYQRYTYTTTTRGFRLKERP